MSNFSKTLVFSKSFVNLLPLYVQNVYKNHMCDIKINIIRAHISLLFKQSCSPLCPRFWFSFSPGSKAGTS